MREIAIKDRKTFILILNYLAKKTKYLELIVVERDDESRRLITEFSKYKITDKEVSSWRGSSSKGTLYKYSFPRNDNYMFKSLERYDSFFFNVTDGKGFARVDYTDFGISNIFFLDKEGDLIFYTITHEGIAYIKNLYFEESK